jgi:hypothetical protein
MESESESQSILNVEQYLIKKYTKIPDQSNIYIRENCCICFNQLENNINKIKICQLCCSHCFHNNCIGKWLDKNKTCPVCRVKCDVYNSNTNNFENEQELPHIPFPQINTQNEFFTNTQYVLTNMIVHDYISLFPTEEEINELSEFLVHEEVNRYFPYTNTVNN